MTNAALYNTTIIHGGGSIGKYILIFRIWNVKILWLPSFLPLGNANRQTVDWLVGDRVSKVSELLKPIPIFIVFVAVNNPNYIN